MKQLSFVLILSLAFLLFFACYHARIETGLPASSQVIDKSFAASWIYGLVPPSTVKAANECPNGVAVVETELSFANQLVGLLTLGIYTPMHIKVTCASSAGMGSIENPEENNLRVPLDAPDQQVVETFEVAAKRAVTEKKPVYVRFE